MPLSPASSFFHVVSASVANAVVMATPVTTTLGRPFPVDSLFKPFPTFTAAIFPAEA
jgi:hypothetical protein